MKTIMNLCGFLFSCVLLINVINGKDFHESFLYNITSPVINFLDKTVHAIAADNDLSQKCRHDMKILLHAYKVGERWALKALDSMGLPETPILLGGTVFLGHFSDCISFKGKSNITGKYCLAHLKYDEKRYKFYWNSTDAYSKMGVALCVPLSCTQTDIEKAVQNSAQLLYPGVQATLEECLTDVRFRMDLATWLVITLFAVVVLLTIIGTFYDVVISKKISRPIQEIETVVKAHPLQRNDTPSINSIISTNSQTSAEVLCKNKTKKAMGILGGILCSFSAIKNINMVWNLSTPSNQDERLNALHGIRVLSLLWIILGHSLAFAKQWIYFKNPKTTPLLTTDILSQPIINGTFAVDTFFFLSGFLLAHTLLKEMRTNKGHFNLPLLYLHRYLRMTPVMMVVIAYSALFLRYMGGGPTFKRATLMYDPWCRKNWWLNALYLQNFIRRENMCLSHTWYSAVDMQFYLLGPLIIYFCYKNVYSAVIALFLPLFATTLLPMLLTLIYHLPAAASNKFSRSILDAYYGSYYIKPYCRMGPHLVGMALAYFMNKNTELVKLAKKYQVLGWTATIAVNIAVLYSMGRINTDSSTDFQAALNNGFSRTAWALSVAWIVYLCASDQARVLNQVLSFKYAIPFSKLTYSAYLIHPVIMAHFYGIYNHTVYFTWFWWIDETTATIMTTYIVSFFLSMLFEFPATNIEKFFRGRR